jgi:hypothetical protein
MLDLREMFAAVMDGPIRLTADCADAADKRIPFLPRSERRERSGRMVSLLTKRRTTRKPSNPCRPPADSVSALSALCITWFENVVTLRGIRRGELLLRAFSEVGHGLRPAHFRFEPIEARLSELWGRFRKSSLARIVRAGRRPCPTYGATNRAQNPSHLVGLPPPRCPSSVTSVTNSASEFFRLRRSRARQSVVGSRCRI